MSPTAPSRRTNPAEKAATKAMRAEVRALLKLPAHALRQALRWKEVRHTGADFLHVTRGANDIGEGDDGRVASPLTPAPAPAPAAPAAYRAA
jgi:hypothetical protein